MGDDRMRAGSLFTLPAGDVDELQKTFLPLVRRLDGFAASMASSPRAAALALSMPSHLASYLPRRFNPDATFFGRLDFVLSGGRPFLIEVNFGTPAGASIDAEAYGKALPASGGSAFTPNSDRMSWLAKQCRDNKHGEASLPIWPWRHFSDPGSYFATTSRIFGEYGVKLRVIELDDLLRRPRPVRLPSLRLFSTIDAYRHGYSADDLGIGATPTINWLHDDSSLVASSKQLLANRQFISSLSEVAQRGLATTRLLESADMQGHGPAPGDYALVSQAAAIAGREHLVLKPCHDQGGAGVVVGQSLTAREWAVLVRRSPSDGTPIVLQTFYRPDPVEYKARNVVTGSTTRLVGVGSYGAYFLGDRLIGLLARVSTFERGACQPINGHTGALVTAIAIESD